MYRVIRDEPPELGNNHTVLSGGESHEGDYQKAGALVAIIMVRGVLPSPLNFLLRVPYSERANLYVKA